jgi:hypothetical protein
MRKGNRPLIEPPASWTADFDQKKYLRGSDGGSNGRPFRCMNSLGNLSVKVFADGAALEGMFRRPYCDPLIRGLTTNPTLARKAGIGDYEAFAKDAELTGFTL